MGNTVIKDVTDSIEEADTHYRTNGGSGIQVFHSSEDLRLSYVSNLSDTSCPLEDAVSITDSTPTTTEYESANENDASSNRLSSGTDISYDVPNDTKSFEKVAQENDICFKLDGMYSHQVSHSSCASPVEFSDNRQFNFCEQLTPEEKNSAEPELKSDVSIALPDDQEHKPLPMNSSTVDPSNHSSKVDILQLQEIASNMAEKAETLEIDSGYSKSGKPAQLELERVNSNVSNFDFINSPLAPFVNHDVRYFVDCNLNSNNSKVQKKWKNLEDLANETKLLKRSRSPKYRRCEEYRKRVRKLAKPVKLKPVSEKNDRARNSENFSNRCGDSFIFNYEVIRKEKAKEIDFRDGALNFYQIGSVLSEALNKVTKVISTSGRCEKSAVGEETTGVRFILYNTTLTNILNVRGSHPTFFEFDYDSVFVQYGEHTYRLEKGVVRRFFHNRWLYIDQLNDVEFCVKCNSQRLRYVAVISEKQFHNLVRVERPVVPKQCARNIESENVMQRVPESDMRTRKSVPTNSESNPVRAKTFNVENEATAIFSVVALERSNNVDTPKISQDWLDTCSLNSEDSFEFPSLRSEIVECAFQLDSIDSQIMNCNENVSEAGPATAADIDSVNNIPFLNDSSELDYISKIGGTGLVAENLRKQSLYVKFDPLVAGEGLPSCNGDMTLKFDDTVNLSNSEALSDVTIQLNSEEKNSSSEVTDSKTSENGTVGKLISVTPNKSPRKKKNKTEFNPVEETKKLVTPRSSPRFPETDPDDVSKYQSLLLKQMKREEAFKEEIESVKRDYEQVLQKLQNTEKEMDQLKVVMEQVQENEKKLKNELKERIKNKQQLNVVMAEYEKTISQMLTKREEEKREYELTMKKLEAERDSTVQHLNNLENAFNDIHQKYERGKVVNEALKKNEDLLKKSLSEYESTVKTVENKYELLKSHATSQLEKANQELELITQSYEKEQAKLKAMLRKSEIQINSLQNALERKTKENQELTAICDELIVKLSTHSNS